jgi:uncharacterized membrane protein YdbT with pleckstrin-like domain
MARLQSKWKLRRRHNQMVRLFWFNLDNQLDSDEKIVRFFRPSRLAYLLHYILIGALVLAAFAIFGYEVIGGGGWWVTILRYIGFLILLGAVVFLIRVEYRIWSRMYCITTERLLYSRGILSQHFESANYQYLTEVSMDQTFWDKLVDCGNLYINTAGMDTYQFRYRQVRHPVEIKKMINDGQDIDRQKKGPAKEPDQQDASVHKTAAQKSRHHKS